MKNIYFYDTIIGKISIMDNGKEIIGLNFNGEDLPKDYIIMETELIQKAKLQLDEYFQGKRKDFQLPLAPEGTEFQQKVWRALIDIPYGETRCYSEIAETIGNPKGARAIGLANNRNPISIFIPCHRVIGKNGKLVGYGGGLDIKVKLLDIEKSKNMGNI